MKLQDYFRNNSGTGVLSTADSDGKVNAAVYSRPHVFDDGTVAFVMRERLTYRNISSTDYASYLFIEAGGGYRGIRLYLKKTGEEDDSPLIAEMTRKSLTAEEDRAKGPKHLVHFNVEKILPLIGSGEPPVEL